ncbi:hypothetical protein CF642_38340, partial [Burkholderia pseudomallei]
MSCTTSGAVACAARPCAAIAAHGLAAHATAPLVVQDIKIDGLQRVEAGSVFAYLPIQQGDTFTDDKASEAIRGLQATSYVNDVRTATQASVVIHHGPDSEELA